MHQAAIYVRAYPHHQEIAERCATEARIARCLEFAQEQGYAVSDAHIYQDIASGLTSDREGLNRLRNALPDICALIVNDFPQLSRDPLMLEQFLVDCKEAGVQVMSVATPPPGYQWNEDHTALEILPEEASIILRFFEEYQV